MLDTLEGFDGGIRCGGMKFSNLRFADDIDLLTEGEEELQEVTDRLNITSKKYCMEINREKSKVMVTGSCNGRERYKYQYRWETRRTSHNIQISRSYHHRGCNIKKRG